ncbi:MAG TPA: tetratricopeptide repeat protein [bacterium]|nr:tetratricopeptide repeat protein [bacterium]
MQKKIMIAVLVGVVGVNGLVFSEFNITRPDAVGGNLVATNQDRTSLPPGLSEGVGAGPGIEFFLKYDINPKVFLTVGTGISTITDKMFQMENFRSTLLPLFEMRVAIKPFPAGQVSPFLCAGFTAFGFQNTVQSTDPVTNTTTKVTGDRFYDAAPFLGGGVEIPVNDKITFQVSGDYRIIVTSSADPKPKLWVAKAGISYTLTQPRRGMYRDEIEYPLGDNELASLEDLFLDDRTGPATRRDDEDALALLFSSAESDVSPTVDQDLFLQDTRELRQEVETKSDALKQLESRISATEQAIAEISSRVAGDYPGAPSGPPLSESVYNQRYQNALNQFYNKNYNEAIRQFQELLGTNPTHKLASNCQYWIGESYNQLRRYSDAIASFNKVMQYDFSYKYDDALIMSGIVYLRLGDRQAARQKFQELLNRYPQSEYAPKAMRYLGRM